MKQLFSHEMHLIDAIGGSTQLTLHEVLRILSRPTSLLFFAIALLALSVTDPPGLLDRMPIYVTWVVWIVSLGVYLALYLTVLALFSLLRRPVPEFPIYLPLVSILALLPSIYLAEHLAEGLSGTRDPVLFDRIIFDYLSAQSFELVFLRFVLPTLNLAAPPIPEPDLVVAPPRLSLGEARFDWRAVLYLTAQEHYVRVTHADGSVLHRARLSDLIAQAPDGIGCQPHRSWWVSKIARPVADREAGRFVLRLGDGTAVPVARGRVAETRAWLARIDGPDGLT